MPRDPNESKVHHFIPKSVLRRFAADAGRSYVVVFDKVSGRSWNGGLTPTGSAKGYNTLVQPNGELLNFEDEYNDIDGDYAALGNELTERRSLAGVDAAFRARLADVAAVQFLRTPIVRSTLNALPRDLVAKMRSKGLEAPDDAELPDDNATRQSTRNMIAGRASTREALLTKDIVLFEPAGASRFWTSDHPVARFSKHPLGELGLRSQGVEIYLPIAADLTVGFLCPSLRAFPVTTEGIQGLRSITMDEVLRSGAPLRVQDPVVNFFNSLQVESSQQHLYASADEFELARQILAIRPYRSRNDTLIQMGEIGEAPPRPANMPPGDWLYLETDLSHLMIPIIDYRQKDAHEMSTERLDLLAIAKAAGPFVRAEIYAAAAGGGMREVEIEPIDPGPPARFRLVHADPALKALDAAIARSSRKRS